MNKLLAPPHIKKANEQMPQGRGATPYVEYTPFENTQSRISFDLNHDITINQYPKWFHRPHLASIPPPDEATEESRITSAALPVDLH
ncbi:hypothetical protein [Herbaspirillum robiniae]|uniref:Uncharacterized protein n=1 Tax=Herbaspirillum robiniae TaxID=2014887 RepID=A0ABX2M0K6_9BURK|nr:hypothetical protein [Herbaspirillum robiniae]NUU03518.1 hypothetical protein [Herbaspirillum robiniae]